MNLKTFLLITAPFAIVSAIAFRQASTGTPAVNAPSYTASGELKFPANYREWVYLSAGFDMSYNPAMNMDHHMFDNVFVNPEAYQSFRKTGTWPDKTMLVLETRGAKSKGSINQAGNFQDADVMGVELHIKDESRFKAQGNWAFFVFDGDKPAKMTPTSLACYSCHAQHGAVDSTFVQFYPTLLPIAQSHSTLSPAYTKDSAATP